MNTFIDNKKKIKILYIAGYGRSGSTLLDSILGNHDSIFSAGELCNLFETVRKGQSLSCSCGALVHGECQFWSDVLKQIRHDLSALEPSEGHRLTRKVQNRWEKHTDSELREYFYLWESAFNAIQYISSCQVIVDSSKSARGQMRLQHLAAMSSVELYVLHLTRDPRAVVWSRLRGANKNSELVESKPGIMLKTIVGWMVANCSVLLYLRKKHSIPSIHIRYEDLMLEPEMTLVMIGEFLELNMMDVIEKVSEGLPIEVGHGIAGNRMRTAGAINKLVPDLEWKNNLSAFRSLIVGLTWPVARLLGYNLLARDTNKIYG